MALTGPITLMLAILLCVGTPVLAVVLWNRGSVGTPATLVARLLMRVVLIGLCQVSAVALVGVLVNDSGSFYSSWREVIGDHHRVTHPVVLPGAVDAAVQARLGWASEHGHGLVVTTTIPGSRSGVGTFKALVYLPAEYGLNSYASRRFPVVELIAGSPGTPQTWQDGLHVAATLDAEIAAGRSLPFVAVMPDADVGGARDTQCVNVVKGPAAETYLVDDVRDTIAHEFRVDTDAHAWSLMGYSSGGFCAVNLAMRHPDRFAAAVSIAGYNHPAHDHQTGELFGRDTALRDLNTPIWRETHLPLPNVAVLLMTSRQDPGTGPDAATMAAAARPPFTVTRVSLRSGGHNFEVWRAEEPVAFAWLTTHLTAPLAAPPIVDGTTPVRSGG